MVSPLRHPLTQRPLLTPTRDGSNSVTGVRETRATEERVGGGLKPVAADYKQHYCADTQRFAGITAHTPRHVRNMQTATAIA